MGKHAGGFIPGGRKRFGTIRAFRPYTVLFSAEGIEMVIRQIHHAEFLIETESGFRIVTDPYDSSCGYPVEAVRADAVLVSHGHHDHNAVETISGHPTVISTEGIFSPDPMIRVTAVTGYHDDEEGRKRGTTLLFLIEAEGLRIVHLGDLGCALDEEKIRKLFRPDILMIPVGGFFTIDGKQAAETAKALGARTVLPMHYKSGIPCTRRQGAC